MKKCFLILIASITLISLSACFDGDWTNMPTPAPEVSAVPAPEVMLPSGRAKNKTFGLAFLKDSALNPIKDSDKINRELYPLVYEGLFELDRNFAAQPVLCEAYETADGITYLFTLRGGVVFGDGSELTARDAEYSLKLAQKSETYGARLEKLASIRAVGELTLEIRLYAANYSLPEQLDVPVIKNGSENQSPPPGTGPYAIYAGETESYLIRNANWWKGAVLSQNRIELAAVENTDELIYSFEAQSVDLVSEDLAGTGQIGFQGDYEIFGCPTTYMQYIGFNVKKDGLSSAEVRRAVGYAIDREYICGTIMSRHAVASSLPVHPAHAVFDAGLNVQNAYSLRKLSEILEAEGFSDTDNDGILNLPENSNKQLEFTMIINAENTYKCAAASYIASVLRGVGISVTIRELKWEEYVSALTKGDFDIYYAEVRLTGDFDISPIIGSGGALNYGGFGSADINSKLAALAGADSARPEAARSLYAAVAEEAPIAPVLFKNQYVLVRRGAVTNLNPTVQNAFYGLENIKINNN